MHFPKSPSPPICSQTPEHILTYHFLLLPLSVQKLQTLLLSPLSEVSLVGHPDVRQKQLESLLHILHSCGELLHHGWPLILNIIGAINDNHRLVLKQISMCKNCKKYKRREVMLMTYYYYSTLMFILVLVFP